MKRAKGAQNGSLSWLVPRPGALRGSEAFDRVAADVVTGLRQKLSDNMVRDNSQAEGARSPAWKLLDAVNYASTGRWAVVDAP